MFSQAQVNITTVFISEVQWQDIRPLLRASPEPYYIDVPFLTKQGQREHISRVLWLIPIAQTPKSCSSPHILRQQIPPPLPSIQTSTIPP